MKKLKVIFLNLLNRVLSCKNFVISQGTNLFHQLQTSILQTSYKLLSQDSHRVIESEPHTHHHTDTQTDRLTHTYTHTHTDTHPHTDTPTHIHTHTHTLSGLVGKS